MTTCMNTAFDVTGACLTMLLQDVSIYVLKGFEKSVAYRSGALQQIVSTFGAVDILEMTASRAVWTQIQNLSMLQNRDGDLWRVSVKPTDGRKCCACHFTRCLCYGLVWWFNLDARVKGNGRAWCTGFDCWACNLLCRDIACCILNRSCGCGRCNPQGVHIICSHRIAMG